MADDESQRHQFRDGSFAEISITRVPETGQFPEGVKYGFQYVGTDETPILRYDNAHGTHERHEGEGSGEPIEFAGNVEEHLRQFLAEIDRIKEESK